MTCQFCGTENTYGELFCTNCGAQLADGPAVPSNDSTAITPVTTIALETSLQEGRYTITKSLGAGGMGSVLLAKDTRLGDKLVVVKVLNAESNDPEKLQEDVRNFKREVETLANLNHPWIPRVTDHFQEKTHYYMVMDYIEGENLEDRLIRLNKALAEQDALYYALEVLDILEYLSQQEPAIVHRDIKPSNIIIGAKDRHAHLVDFGIARSNTQQNGQRRKTTALGTPGYAPPEQYQGFADPRSDIYALGATLHHLVTNRDPGEYPPFQFPPIRTLNPQLSPSLEQVLAKALRTQANDRYQSAQEMRQDVESIVAGISTTIGTIDAYKISNSRPLRALPPQPSPKISVSEPLAEPVGQTGGYARQQRQQMEEQEYANPERTSPEYTSPGFYPHTPPVSRGSGFREIPRQMQNFYEGYRNSSSQDADTRIMWQFITFVVAICIIGVIAYLLFNTINFF